MKPLALTLSALLAVAGTAQTPAPAPKPEAKPAAPAPPPPPATMGQALERTVALVERQLIPLVEAMPEDKFAFAPTSGEFKGVKTFGGQAKHLGAANYLFASIILGEKPPVDLGKDGEDGPASVKTKADIVQFLKDSFVYVHKAVATVDEKNAILPVKTPWGATATRLQMAALVGSHNMDHYGQMVVYLRMNGIVPPASRR
ncbi:MAG: DinB family protein [Acidobacteria bacterium]|nr:DinB family protein [Acidobacteriota bacterium]